MQRRNWSDLSKEENDSVSKSVSFGWPLVVFFETIFHSIARARYHRDRRNQLKPYQWNFLKAVNLNLEQWK